MAERTCLVVMGFGTKSDFQTGRTLDLDKSYRALIKPAVEGAGVTCVRADEIVHAGSIDLTMYRHLLEADLVIADISTCNPNALYKVRTEVPDQTLAGLTQQAEAALHDGSFELASTLFAAARTLRSNDPFLTQRLALVTYKSAIPTELAALEKARALLNLRASMSAPAEHIADFVGAERVRRRVIPVCEAFLASEPSDASERYWAKATLAEAHVGIGDQAKGTWWLEQANQERVADWMRETTAKQLEALRQLLVPSPLDWIRAT